MRTTICMNGIKRNTILLQKTLQGSACHLCSYVAPTVAALRMHLKKHKKCSHCSYTSRGVPDIKKHYRDVHNMDYEVAQSQTIIEITMRYYMPSEMN